MNKSSTLSRALVFGLALSFWIGIGHVSAGSATWSGNTSGDWLTPENWTPNTAPNGPADIATFDASNFTNISARVPPQIEVDRIVFNAGASAYTISSNTPQGGFEASVLFSGVGIVNNSGITQNFVTGRSIQGGKFLFVNSASAGSMTFFTIDLGCDIQFFNSATAGYATFITEGAFDPLGTEGAIMSFSGNSTAGHSTITNISRGSGPVHGGELKFLGNATAGESNIINSGAMGEHGGPRGGLTTFRQGSSAGNAIIMSRGALFPTSFGSTPRGGRTTFLDSSTASKATLIADSVVNGGGGGEIFFEGDSTGGTARVKVHGIGYLDISGHNATGVTIGSFEGDGFAFLGANNLAVGTNHRSTIFSGSIQDGGASGNTGGSLTKVGLGVLTLSGSSTYTGPTTVNAGKLLVDGSITSAVTVNGGALGGSGTTRSVTVNSGGALSPGKSASVLDVGVDSAGEIVPSGGAGILHVAGDVVLTLGATYLADLKGSVAGNSYDQLDVIGTVNLGNATLALSLAFKPAIGDVLTIINNDADDMIGGTFNGLAEGDQFTVDGETFSISYHGGDGNDVTLTSVAHKRR